MLKYKGGGFLRGVPARDLREDEVARYGYSYLVRSGLYIPEKQEPQVEEPDIVDVTPDVTDVTEKVTDVKPVRRKKRKTKGE